MSKKKHRDECCCCETCCCYEPCCCQSSCCQPYGYQGNNGFLGGFNGGWEAIIFWLIACGAGLLNTNSILIILLFILYGWSQNCGFAFF